MQSPQHMKKILPAISSMFSRADIWTHNCFDCREKAIYNCLYSNDRLKLFAVVHISF